MMTVGHPQLLIYGFNNFFSSSSTVHKKVCNNVEKDVCVDEFDKVCTMTSVKVCRKVAVREEVEDWPEGN